MENYNVFLKLILSAQSAFIVEDGYDQMMATIKHGIFHIIFFPWPISNRYH